MKIVRIHRSFADIAGHLLSRPITRYIRTQRDRLANRAMALPPDMKREFIPYFDAELLEQTRLVSSGPWDLPAAPFEIALRRLGVYIPSIALVSAITLDNLIAVRDEPSPRLLFHELVHVAQFRLLGISTFAKLYVTGFLAEGSYEAIPLERCASALEERFSLRREQFSAEAAVVSWLKRDPA
jgi:hypothetical protein